MYPAYLTRAQIHAIKLQISSYIIMVLIDPHIWCIYGVSQNYANSLLCFIYMALSITINLIYLSIYFRAGSFNHTMFQVPEIPASGVKILI